MSVHPIGGKGVNRASANCDACGREEVVTRDYEGRRAHDWRPNVGQVHRKLTAHGWQIVSGDLLCPACVAARKAKTAAKPKEDVLMDKDMARETSVVTPLREPSREQKRQIIDLLGEVYDLPAQRYKGRDTDKSVADVIGGGCMPGWVAQIREDLFGPDGGNAEMEAVLADAAACKERAHYLNAKEVELTSAAKQLQASAGELKADADRLNGVACELIKRLNAIRTAVGPKAGAA